MVKCVKDHLEKKKLVNDEKVRGKILLANDCKQVGISNNHKIVYEKVALEIQFIENFKKEWVHENPYWYEGAFQHVPCTNNGLGATNKYVHKRSRYQPKSFTAMGKFVFELNNSIGQYSRLCKIDLVYATNADIPNENWIRGYEW